MTDSQMSCREIVDLVTDYLEDALPRSERARFEAHIDGCDGCAAAVEQFRMTIRITGHVSEDQLTPPLRGALIDAFRDWKRARNP